MVAATSAALGGVCIAAIDQPVARWLATRDTWPAAWNRGIAVLEICGGIEPWKWIGVIVLVGGVIATQLRWRTHAAPWLLVASTHLVARNLTLPIKTITGRLRPTEWLARPGDSFWRDGGIAFPSGHVVLFASLVLPIVVAFPRARPLIAIVAFAMVARIVVDAHFVSDALAGLALAAAVTWLCAAAVDRWSPPPPVSPR